MPSRAITFSKQWSAMLEGKVQPKFSPIQPSLGVFYSFRRNATKSLGIRNVWLNAVVAGPAFPKQFTTAAHEPGVFAALESNQLHKFRMRFGSNEAAPWILCTSLSISRYAGCNSTADDPDYDIVRIRHLVQKHGCPESGINALAIVGASAVCEVRCLCMLGHFSWKGVSVAITYVIPHANTRARD